MQASSPTPDTAPSIPETPLLLQWQAEAADAVTAAAPPDLHERVRELTARILHERRVPLADARDVIRALTACGSELKGGLKEATAGLDEALSHAAEAASLSLREMTSQGRAFKDNELKSSLTHLRDLESQLVEGLKDTAALSSGKLKEELGSLAEHMKLNGTRTGEQVKESLTRLAQGLKASGKASQSGVREAAELASERLSEAASGVLAAMADSLKRQSERLHQRH
ncbi:MAG: DUF6781 family protein [Thiobacillus sp.]